MHDAVYIQYNKYSMTFVSPILVLSLALSLALSLVLAAVFVLSVSEYKTSYYIYR